MAMTDRPESALDKIKRVDRLLMMSPEERRQEPREELTEGTATIDDKSYPLRNWSARGFCIGDVDFEASPTRRLQAKFSVTLPTQTLEFSCRIVVVRVIAEKNEIGGTFVNVDKVTQEKIDEHFAVFSPKRSLKRSFLGRLTGSKN
jgi:hypothetical protein